MPPAFETIPVEIQKNNYSYILLDQNIAYAVGPCISLDAYKLVYETALFKVSKLISTESLQYFYSQNNFFIFTLNPKRNLNKLLLRKCRIIIPICGNPAAITTPKHIALEIYISLPEQSGSQHECNVIKTKQLAPRYILPNNFKFEERRIPLPFKRNKQICFLTAKGQSHDLQQQPAQSAPATEHVNSKTRPQPHRVNGINMEVELLKSRQQNIFLKRFAAEAQSSKMSTTVFAARHCPHFIHLLNEVVSESHRWAENQIRSTLAIKLGSFNGSPRIAELLVGGLNGIRGSNFTKAVLPEKNTIPMQDLDVPKLPLIDVKLLGNVSQEYREKITAMGTSTIKTILDTIN